MTTYDNDDFISGDAMRDEKLEKSIINFYGVFQETILGIMVEDKK